MTSPFRPSLHRRDLLRGAGAAAALTTFAPLAAARRRRRRRSPGEELRVAVAGLHGRGRAHVDGFRSLPDVRVVALVDVDRDVLAARVKEFEARGEKVDTEVDLRRVLDRDDVDAVSIATPNHWHSLQGIWACQAGKHVYCEKPVSHEVWEGGQLVAAARRYGRVVQAGTQCRSSHAIRNAIEWVHEGHLGPVRVSRGLCYKPRTSIGKVDGPQDPPKSVDYDLWIGPAKMQPLMRKHLHYDWHWVFDTGNGDLGNQGIHQMDLARWALGVDALPRRVRSIGGRVGYDDDGNTPNTLVTVLEYEEAPLVFEVRGLPRDAQAQAEDWGGRMDTYLGARIGVVVHCENGRLLIPSYDRAVALDHEGNVLREWKGATSHFANFVDAVRANDPGMLHAEIREGHLSSALCHLGNASWLLGAGATLDEAAAEAAPNVALAEAFGRMRTHLVANAVDLTATPLVVGPWLEVDPATERFVGNDAANALLARHYREPYVVPSEV